MISEFRIEKYRLAVQGLAKNREYRLVLNSGPEHARIICSSIFRNADKSVCMAANNLCNTEVACSDEYIQSVCDFLSTPGTMLKIILTDYDERLYLSPETGCLLRTIILHDAYRQGRVQIKQSKGKKFHSYTEEDGTSRKEFHFCIGDDTMYRKETDTVNRSAICNFGDREKTTELRTLFEKAFNSSDVEPIRFAAAHRE